MGLVRKYTGLFDYSNGFAVISNRESDDPILRGAESESPREKIACLPLKSFIGLFGDDATRSEVIDLLEDDASVLLKTWSENNSKPSSDFSQRQDAFNDRVLVEGEKGARYHLVLSLTAFSNDPDSVDNHTRMPGIRDITLQIRATSPSFKNIHPPKGSFPTGTDTRQDMWVYHVNLAHFLVVLKSPEFSAICQQAVEKIKLFRNQKLDVELPRKFEFGRKRKLSEPPTSE